LPSNDVGGGAQTYIQQGDLISLISINN
jgi:hypothetical protein